MVSHQRRQCCKHRYRAKPWKWISCPPSVHSGKSCLSRLGTKMGLKYTDPDPKASMIADHVNQNLRTLLSPIWDDYLFWPVFMWAGAYVVCAGVPACICTWMCLETRMLFSIHHLHFPLTQGSLTGWELSKHIWLASEPQ